jgi:short-subunit dehydrogenase
MLEIPIRSCRCKIIASSGRLDIVINNAGVGITGPLEEIPSEEIKNFETNLFGPIEVMLRYHKCVHKKSGLIINNFYCWIYGFAVSVHSASKGL